MTSPSSWSRPILDPDLDRREAELFVRHGLPSRGHLARVSLGTVAMAVYGMTGLVETETAPRTDARWRGCPWVAYGLGLLPCFVGDADVALARVSAPTTDLAVDYWLVFHPDLRSVARVRRVREWIQAVSRESRAALQGRGARDRELATARAGGGHVSRP